MELNSEIARYIAFFGMNTALANVTSAHLVLLDDPQVDVNTPILGLQPVIHFPIEGYALHINQIRFSMPSAQALRTGVVTWFRLYLDPIGWIDGTVGHFGCDFGCDLNVTSSAFTTSVTAHIDNFNMTVVGATWENYYRAFPGRAVIVNCIEAPSSAGIDWGSIRTIPETQEPKRFTPAPGSIDLFW